MHIIPARTGAAALFAASCHTMGALMGKWDSQPRREVLVAARTRNQAAIVHQYVQGLIAGLPEQEQARFKIRRGQRLEIEFDKEHALRCIAADPKNALGTSPTLAIMDERGHWPDDKGDALEAALLSGLGKRDGLYLMISTSASSDTRPFSQWLDDPSEGNYVQEHRPAPGQPADDMDSILEANPGAEAGIGSSPKWLKAQARRAIARDGSALSSFRLYNRNERVSGERRDMLLEIDTWLDAETSELPPREDAAVVGVDLGGSEPMPAAVLYWPNTRRMEAFGAFSNNPSLKDRGLRDGMRDRYMEMKDRGELLTMGEKGCAGRAIPAIRYGLARRRGGGVFYGRSLPAGRGYRRYERGGCCDPGRGRGAAPQGRPHR